MRRGKAEKRVSRNGGEVRWPRGISHYFVRAIRTTAEMNPAFCSPFPPTPEGKIPQSNRLPGSQMNCERSSRCHPGGKATAKQVAGHILHGDEIAHLLPSCHTKILPGERGPLKRREKVVWMLARTEHRKRPGDHQFRGSLPSHRHRCYRRSGLCAGVAAHWFQWRVRGQEVIPVRGQSVFSIRATNNQSSDACFKCRDQQPQNQPNVHFGVVTPIGALRAHTRRKQVNQALTALQITLADFRKGCLKPLRWCDQWHTGG